MPTSVDPDAGLSGAEVAERVAAGQVNDVPKAPSRTVGQIVRANVFTRFNALMVGLAAIPLALGEWRDALFLGVVVANALIGIVQELRAKRTLDRLSVVTAPRVAVVRDGAVAEIGMGDLVLDDVVELTAGGQVVADGTVLRSDNLELDESLLTGESDAVVKELGDELLSGSFVVAGRGRAQITKVGRDAYAVKLAEEARRFTLVRSQLRGDINTIIRFVTWILVPTAILQFVSALWFSGESVEDSLLGAVAGVVGMVPEGLVLLTSVAFAVGVVRLAERRTLVQELPAIEVLARVDTLCSDKTGTITEGSMVVLGITSVGSGMPAQAGADGSGRPAEAGTDGAEGTAALAAIGRAEPDPNATLLAVRERAGTDPGWELVERVPFSSARKWSAYSFADHGTWVIGAPEIVLGGEAVHGDVAGVADEVEAQAEAGRRVLLLARTDQPVDGEGLPSGLAPAALVLLEDQVRSDAPETLHYFAIQGVDVKVLSGDNPTTVAAVARRAGLDAEGDAVDARTLPDDEQALADILETHDVFGRVTPHQKRAMVHALQSRGHVVAMTGDGVNDVLALKDADCGIAMASGSEASRAVAQLVLLDSNFSALPAVVGEGRRVINNIERVASLFLTKTTYATILAILTGILTLPFPFRPRHLTLISTLTIGIPAFFLALAPNQEIVHPGFLRRITRVAVPGGVLVAAAALITYGVARLDDSLTLDQDRTAAVLAAGGVAFVVLLRVARPLNVLRVLLVGTMIGLFTAAFVVPPVAEFFALEWPGLVPAAVAAATVVVSVPLLELGIGLVGRFQVWWATRHTTDTTGVSPPTPPGPEAPRPAPG